MAILTFLKIGLGLAIIAVIGALYLRGELLSKDLALETTKAAQEKANADTANAAVVKWQKEAHDRDVAAAVQTVLSQQLQARLDTATIGIAQTPQIITKYVPAAACPLPVDKLLPGFFPMPTPLAGVTP